MPKPGSYFQLAYFFGSVPLLFGLWACVIGIRDEVREIQSEHWPTAQGRAFWLENRFLYFDYAVNGTNHRSSGFSFSDSGDLAAFRLRHPAGSVATVRYDPAEPTICRLEIPTPANSTGMLGPGLVIITCAVVFLIAYRRADRSVTADVRKESQTQDPMEPALLSMAVALAVMLGLLGVGYGVISSWKTVRAGFWPTAPAEIVHMQVDVSITDSSKPDEGSERAAVAYRYTVNGKTYYSSQRRFGSTGTRMEHMISSYPVGKRIVAFYSPDDPQIAVLEAGFDAEHLVLPAVGLVPILFVVLFSYVIRFVSGHKPLP